MSLNVTVGLDEQTLAVFNKLADAISSVGGVAPAAAAPAKPGKETPSETGSSSSSKEEDTGPFYWKNKAGDFGEAKTKAEYQKLKKKDDSTFRIPENQYDELVEALRKKNEDAKAAAKAEKDKPADKGEKSKGDDAPEAPSREDLIALFTGFLPKDLDADVRKERREFVITLLQRFGAAKVTELDEEHWALAYNLLQRKIDGEDVDPAKANFDKEDADDDGDLV